MSILVISPYPNGTKPSSIIVKNMHKTYTESMMLESLISLNKEWEWVVHQSQGLHNWAGNDKVCPQTNRGLLIINQEHRPHFVRYNSLCHTIWTLFSLPLILKANWKFVIVYSSWKLKIKICLTVNSNWYTIMKGSGKKSPFILWKLPEFVMSNWSYWSVSIKYVSKFGFYFYYLLRDMEA